MKEIIVNEIIGTSFESKEAALDAFNKRYPSNQVTGWGVEFIECDQCGNWFVLPNEKVYPELRQMHIDNQDIRIRHEELYHSAFDDEPEQIARYFCSDECEVKASDSDEGWFTCEECYRTIVTTNGYNNQYRVVDDSYMVCLRCYEQDILENGIPRESFEQKEVAGMFFSSDNNEPLENGYDAVPQFSRVFIKSQESIDEYCKAALRFIKRGCKVITGYESLSILGNEGFVTMFVKYEKKGV